MSEGKKDNDDIDNKKYFDAIKNLINSAKNMENFLNDTSKILDIDGDNKNFDKETILCREKIEEFKSSLKQIEETFATIKSVEDYTTKLFSGLKEKYNEKEFNAMMALLNSHHLLSLDNEEFIKTKVYLISLLKTYGEIRGL